MAGETRTRASGGAVIGVVKLHEAWHDQVASIEATAGDALDRAEQARHVRSPYSVSS